jgi:glucose-1-phosphate cytidylyltransferase
MTKVVILCGGKGTRLREETEHKPKPMVSVGGKPILWHLMKIFSHYSLNDFILCLGYKSEVIKEYFYNYELLNNDFKVKLGTKEKEVLNRPDLDEFNWSVILADTGLENMTGSRIKKIEKYIANDPYFIVTYGDAVADINIEKLLEFHQNSGKIATLTGVRTHCKYGNLETEGNLIKKFNEKPLLENYVNGGFFVFNKEIFKFLGEQESCVLEQKPLETLANMGELGIYKHDGFWECMDTYRDYELLNSMYDKNNAPWMIWKDKYKIGKIL